MSEREERWMQFFIICSLLAHSVVVQALYVAIAFFVLFSNWRHKTIPEIFGKDRS